MEKNGKNCWDRPENKCGSARDASREIYTIVES